MVLARMGHSSGPRITPSEDRRGFLCPHVYQGIVMRLRPTVGDVAASVASAH